MMQAGNIYDEAILTDDKERLELCADLLCTEAQSLLHDLKWKKEIFKDKLLVESKEAPLKFNGVRIFRGTVEVDCPPNLLFEFISGPNGYQVLNPDSEQEHHDIIKTCWRDSSSLSVHVARVKMPMPLKHREIVVLRAVDRDAYVFASKSVIHSSRPGASRHFKPEKGLKESEHKPWIATQKNIVRAFSVYALVVEQVKPNHSRVIVINLADMGLNAWAMNAGTKQHIFNTLERIQQKGLDINVQHLSEMSNNRINRADSHHMQSTSCLGCDDMAYLLAKMMERIKISIQLPFLKQPLNGSNDVQRHGVLQESSQFNPEPKSFEFLNPVSY